MFNSVEDIGQCFIHFSYHCCCFLLAELFVSSAVPQTVACQLPLSMGFPRQEHWSRLPFSSPGHFPNHGIKPASPAWQANSLPLSHQGSSFMSLQWFNSRYLGREETGMSVGNWPISLVCIRVYSVFFSIFPCVQINLFTSKTCIKNLMTSLTLCHLVLDWAGRLAHGRVF